MTARPRDTTTACALGVLTGEAAQSESSSSGQKPAGTPPPKGAKPGRYSPYSGDSHCRRFNRGHCSASACRFDHVCSFCNATGHRSDHQLPKAGAAEEG